MSSWAWDTLQGLEQDFPGNQFVAASGQSSSTSRFPEWKAQIDLFIYFNHLFVSRLHEGHQMNWVWRRWDVQEEEIAWKNTFETDKTNPGRELGDQTCAGGNWRMEGRLRHSKGLSWARQLGNGAWGKDAWDLISASLCTSFCAHLGTLELTQKTLLTVHSINLFMKTFPSDAITVNGPKKGPKLHETKLNCCWTAPKYKGGHYHHIANRKPEPRSISWSLDPSTFALPRDCCIMVCKYTLYVPVAFYSRCKS